MFRVIKPILITFAIAVTAYGGPNLLSNPSFENLGPGGSTVIFSGLNNGGGSAADQWMIWNNTAGSTTRTQLCPYDVTCPITGVSPVDGAEMLYVNTDNAFNGVWQSWLPANAGPPVVTSSVWIYMLRGTVGVGSGNDGSTVLEAFATTPVGANGWQLLTWSNVSPFNTPANEIVFYATSAGGAEFYLDAAYVDANIPEPATLSLFGLGLAAIGYGARRLRRRE